MTDYARSVSILVNIAGNPEARLDDINKRLDGISGKKVNVGPEPANQMERLAAQTNKVDSAFNSAGNKITSTFGNIKNSLNDLQGGVQNLMNSLAGIAIGGSISGFSFVYAAQTEIATEQIYKAIEANKKWQISEKETQELVDRAKETGYVGSEREMLEIVQAAGLTTKLKGQALLDISDAAAKLSYATQETYGKSGEDIIRMASRKTLRKDDMQALAGMLAASGVELKGGVDDPRLKSLKSRQKLLQEASDLLDMEAETTKRPWKEAENAVDDLSKAIGKDLVPVMVPVIKGFTTIIGLIEKMPGGPLLIGLAAGALALASATSLLVGVMASFYNSLKVVNAATGIGTALKWLLTGATTANTVVTEKSVQTTLFDFAAKNANTGAIVTNTAATNTSIVSRLRLVAAKSYDTAATFANSAANFLGISSLLGLAAAEGTATVGAWGLAAGIWAAMAPLLPFIAAGLLAVGALALLADKAGVLKPLLEGISKINLGEVFSDLIKGDWGRAWKDITKGFKLPTLAEMWSNLRQEVNLADFVKFTGPGVSLSATMALVSPMTSALADVFGGKVNFAQLLNKYFGIPLYSILKWLDLINSSIEKVSSFIYDNTNRILTPLFKILDKIKDVYESIKAVIVKFVGGSALSKEEQKSALIDSMKVDQSSLAKLKPEQQEWLANYITGNKKALGGKTTMDMGITDPQIDFARNLYDNMMKEYQKPLISMPPAIAEADKKIAAKGKEMEDKEKEAIANKDPWSFFATQYSGGFEAVGMAGTGIYNFLTGHAKGGLITRSGLLIGHTGEPVIPAEVASSSRLQNVLETIAYGGNTSTVTNSPEIHYHYTGSISQGIVMDKFAFERAVKEIIGRNLRTYGAY